MKKPIKTNEDLILTLARPFMEHYWSKIYDYLQKNPQYIKTCPGFLVKPEKIILYLTKTHLGVEYVGNEILDALPSSGGNVDIQLCDLTNHDNWIDEVIGFSYQNSSGFKFPLPEFLSDLILPTKNALTKLSELGWNWSAQSSVIGLNCSGIEIEPKRFYRLINCIFFDSQLESLVTRRIKWLDLVPLHYVEEDENTHSFQLNLAPYANELFKLDCQMPYPLPKDYKYRQLQKANRFVEFVGDTNNDEPKITKFLAQDEYIFILTMAFFSKEIHHQKKCLWQGGVKKDPIIPDFLVVSPDGYANIVEFKMPKLKGASIVGANNREAFSAEINSYIAQTRVYEEYFDDSANRKWVEEMYSLKVLKPKRYLVVGRRWNFSSEEWRRIKSDYQNIEVVSYDDLIDGVVSQFYAK